MHVQHAHTLAAGVRRSGRIPKEIPIILSGADADGRQFSERTRTLTLSRHGASIISRHKLIAEQEIYLHSVPANRETEVRICGEFGEREDGHIYGVAFVDPAIDFWKLEFPPGEAFGKQVLPVILECSGCTEQKDVQFDATELDIYTVNEGSLRYCDRCGRSTVWKIAAERKRKPEPVPVADPQPAPLPSPLEIATAAEPPVAQVPEAERRRDRRTKVKCNACVRVSGGKEEIVPCQDMSRGGFSFQTNKEYPVETNVEAAVPFTPGGNTIFVPAQIVNVRTLQQGKLFRYGAAYLRTPKPGS